VIEAARDDIRAPNEAVEQWPRRADGFQPLNVGKIRQTHFGTRPTAPVDVNADARISRLAAPAFTVPSVEMLT
jgi:hypothetical protein